VIGAGLAGLTAARTLRAAGLDVELFDKARGPGGRTSTRRAPPFAFDHGAQYFTCKSEQFRSTVSSWCDAGVVCRWSGRIASLRHGVVTPTSDSVERFVGVPRMSAIARHLSRGLALKLERRVASVERASGRWSLRLDDGVTAGGFEGLIVATPAPQALPLLETAGVEALSELVRGVSMTPCHALMLGFDRRLDVEFDGAFVSDSALSWIAHDTSKPGRSEHEAWVAHSTPAWSAAHLETSREAVVERLLEALASALGREVAEPAHTGLHLWRLALAPEPLTRPAVFLAEHGIGVCGDWMHGARIESAVESGEAMAGEILGLAGTR